MKLRSYTLALLLSGIALNIAASDVIEAKDMAHLNDIIAQNENVVVDIYGTWCPPCRLMAPEFAKLPAEFPNIKFVKIQVEYIDPSWNITAIPVLISFKNGQVIEKSQEPGAKMLPELKDYVNTFFNN